ncbi:MAG: glycosyltransferase family 39 protein [Candidatus Andersenbacteria bacterium]|nr:glycosyltransferase family 39 protein [Candidatus Andersenbacteria bacterium]MBI3250239.1 glycosyltransferase family 39 protein [Candidatus Andersenbacteria bacterium]
MVRWYNIQYTGGKLLTSRWLWVSELVLVLGVLWLSSPVDIIEEVRSPGDINSRFLLGDTRTVGQTFTAIPNLRVLELPVEVEPGAQGPIILHIRRDYFGRDLRSSVIFRPGSGTQTFVFEPINVARGETLMWVLENPHDPDRSISVFREIDGSLYLGGEAYTKGKELAGDFQFKIFGSRPLVTAIPSMLAGATNEFIFLDDGERQALIVGLIVALIAWLFAPRIVQLLRWFLYRPRLTLVLLMVVTFALHITTAKTIPLNNDEGAYLQDALQAQEGFVPVKDFLTKGPVYVYVLSIWTNLVPFAVPFLRLLSTGAWIAGVLLVYRLSRELGLSVGIALTAAALLALSPAAVLLSTPLLLQSISAVLVLGGLLLTIMGAKRENVWFVVVSAICMVAAYLTRASSIPAAVVGLGIILWFSERNRFRLAATYTIVGLLVTGSLFTAATLYMGLEKATVAFNIEALAVSQAREIIETTPEEPIVRWSIESAMVLWSMSPWFIAGVLALPWFLFKYVSRWQTILLLALWLLLASHVWFHLNDMSYFVGALHKVARVLVIFSVILPLFIAAVRWLLDKPAPALSQTQARVLILMLAWILMLGMIYRVWSDFRPNYLLEFLPPLALITAQWGRNIWAAITTRPHRNATRFALGAVVLIAVTGGLAGWRLGLRFPPSGTMDLGALSDIVNEVKTYVPPREPLFTAQSAVTALARRPMIFQYSHSGWYLYERQGLVPTELLQLFFQSPESITSYLDKTVQFILVDRRTQQVYFDTYEERQRILAEDFESIVTVKNGDDTFELYRRKIN